MSEKFTPTNIEENDVYQSAEENDYKSLITRLQKISKIIASLEKKFLNKI